MRVNLVVRKRASNLSPASSVRMVTIVGLDFLDDMALIVGLSHVLLVDLIHEGGGGLSLNRIFAVGLLGLNVLVATRLLARFSFRAIQHCLGIDNLPFLPGHNRLQGSGRCPQKTR